MPTLDWIGKRAVVNHHRELPYRLLHCDDTLSEGAAGAGNLLVEGDNLHALKALLPYYAGRVKCIYIDPPYNTGNEGWVYNDNVNAPEIQKWLGDTVGKEAEDLSRHDKWLCMMYPRLALLREFLTEDGAIFISIDDNELMNLLYVMEEIFGAQNHLATIVWEKGKKGDSKFFSENHEYIVTYARNKALLVERNTKWKRRKAGVDKVLAHYEELREKLADEHEKIREEMMKWYRSLPKENTGKAHKHYNWSDARGLYFPDNFHGPDDGRESRPRYDIIHPKTGKPCAKPSTGWRWEEARTKAALAEDPQRIHFGPDETTIPCRKTYLKDASQEPFPTVFYKDGRAATLAVEQLLGKGRFAFPKDAEVIADLVGMVTQPGDLILDSFAGSGTTGHAVLALNDEARVSATAAASEKPGLFARPEPATSPDRRFILCEMEPKIARDITAERLRRVIAGYGDTPGLGGGFRFCTLGEPLFNEDGHLRSDVKWRDLAHHVWFSETGGPLPAAAAGQTDAGILHEGGRRAQDSPLIGVTGEGGALYLLYNGILGDRRPEGGNVLTPATLAVLPPHAGPRTVYGEACTLRGSALSRERIVFKQIPYQVRQQ